MYFEYILKTDVEIMIEIVIYKTKNPFTNCFLECLFKMTFNFSKADIFYQERLPIKYITNEESSCVYLLLYSTEIMLYFLPSHGNNTINDQNTFSRMIHVFVYYMFNMCVT